MTFNLIDEPWILAQDKEGIREVSLREAFNDAEKLVQLTGEIPTQAFALLRLMLAICHDAIGFPHQDDVEEMRMDGLDLAKINAYLDEHHDRFELFDPKRPFMQVADLRTAKGEASGLEKLIADVPNGVPFFTTRAGDALKHISASEAARWLVHVHAFDPSGIRSGAAEDLLAKGGKGYPIGPGWAGQIGGVVIHGQNLMETLALNLTPTNASGDIPVWRLPESHTYRREEETLPNGSVQTLVWQSRRVRLEGGVNGVTGIVLCQGDKVAPQRMEPFEPMTAWRYSKPQTQKFGRAVYMPKQHEAGRSMWRGLPSLIASGENVGYVEDRGSQMEASHPAQTLDGLEYDRGLVVVQSIGMQYGAQNAVTEEIIDERLEIQGSLLGSHAGEAQAVLSDAITIADNAVRTLGQMAANIARAAGERGDNAGEGARQRAMEDAWARLDTPARRWIRQLTPENAIESRVAWRREVVDLMERLAKQLAQEASPAAVVGRETSFGYMSAAKAHSIFIAAIRKHISTASDREEKK